ncbi:sensor histidine kinase [Gabonibacter chumensis]|uniref:sensor histidine kinase n=1 Tax=Gabonibacter chumensis TaxID=2972474 RepID=UPI0025734417|nr:ATP-binding protein [Gabonibacter chumensis]MCR9011606.1 ATP-binding protein [Gabonibacter chumensis]
MKLSYKQKLFLYFFVVFSIFTIGIIFFQQKREKAYKTENLRTTLNDYATILAQYIDTKQLVRDHRIDSIQNILQILPHNLRVTLLNRTGKVLFDNSIEQDKEIENHLQRPEIQTALIHSTGAAVRHSTTLGIEYYYYAKAYPHFFIRVALPYDIEVQNFLKTDNIFLYFITLLFFIALISLIYLSDRFGKAISGLKDFIVSADHHKVDYNHIHFPHTELGEIGNKIIRNYQLLEESNRQINVERDKLLRHFHYSDEGIAIFAANGEKIYANTHFIQYLNTLLDEPTFRLEGILEQPDFIKLNEFLKNNTPVNPNAHTIPVFQCKLSKGGKHFALKLLLFTDNSYEITLNNISDNEKNRLLKQEMTNNIAHELKTPVSSIRGYIETLLEQPDITPDKQHFFLERTYSQVVRLSDLIRDIALITKTEEASELFQKEEVNIYTTIQEVITDLNDALTSHSIIVQNHIKEDLFIEGNKTLIYAIFRNLMDNSINYAGDHIIIVIDNYTNDQEFCYFSYYDTGQGVDEMHLNRLFERFYRVCAGRSRQTGGSGLGLSIVKNAVLFHKGEISAKNRKEGGLEFLFSLRKKLF